MTAQIGDKLLIENSQYTVLRQSAPLEFEPARYGILPSSTCTACWRGFWCVYKIRDGGIFLEDLYIHSARDVYPEINGVSPLVTPDGKPESHFGHRLYKGLNIRMDYTGKLIVGDGFIRRYYVHMGLQVPWAHERLAELVFENGALAAENDLSEVAANIRKRIMDEFFEEDGITPREGSGESTPFFIGRRFPRSLGFTAWWL